MPVQSRLLEAVYERSSRQLRPVSKLPRVQRRHHGTADESAPTQAPPIGDADPQYRKRRALTQNTTNNTSRVNARSVISGRPKHEPSSRWQSTSAVDRIQSALFPSPWMMGKSAGYDLHSGDLGWDQLKAFVTAGARPTSKLVHMTKRLAMYDIDLHNIYGRSKQLSIALARENPARIKDWRELLRTYNAITAYLISKDTPLWSSYASNGLFLAIQARSVPALLHYFAKVCELDKAPPKFYDTLSLLNEWITIEKSSVWPSWRLLLGLKSVLIESDRASRLLEMMIASGSGGQQKMFVSILSKVCEPTTVFQAWVQFESSAQFSAYLRDPSGASLRASRPLSAVVHYHVKALIQSGGPDLAWRLVNRLQWEPDQFLGQTWHALLEYPEHITEWNEAMREPVLRKYESMIQDIEQALGVQWTGGEDGKHLFVDDAGDVEEVHDSLITKTSQAPVK